MGADVGTGVVGADVGDNVGTRVGAGVGDDDGVVGDDDGKGDTVGDTPHLGTSSNWSNSVHRVDEPVKQLLSDNDNDDIIKMGVDFQKEYNRR
jgi:hypothetical protein